MQPLNGQAVDGAPVDGDATVLQLARQLVNEDRAELPVANKTGKIIGILNRQDALDILLGSA